MRVERNPRPDWYRAVWFWMFAISLAGPTIYQRLNGRPEFAFEILIVIFLGAGCYFGWLAARRVEWMVTETAVLKRVQGGEWTVEAELADINGLVLGGDWVQATFQSGVLRVSLAAGAKRSIGPMRPSRSWAEALVTAIRECTGRQLVVQDARPGRPVQDWT